MTEIDPVSKLLGEYGAVLEEMGKDVTEIKSDVKSLLLFRAQVTGLGTLGGMIGGAVVWMVVSRVDKQIMDYASSLIALFT